MKPLSLLVASSLLMAGVASAETPPGVWERVADPGARARYDLHLRVVERLAAKETVVTLRTDYLGELVARVVNDHISIRVLSGEVKTFPWADVDRMIDQVVGVMIRLKTREYRGGLVEDVPNDHVTITLANGEVRTFQWEDIDVTRTVDTPTKVADLDEFWRTNLDNTLTLLTAAGAAQSPDVRLRFDLARVLETYERYDEAAAVIESGLALAPDHPMAQEELFQLAICNDHRNQEEALRTYERYLKVASRPDEQAIAYSNRSEAEMNLGRLEEAIEDARYAAELGAGDRTSIAGLAQFDLAIALDRYGDPRGASKAADWAVNDEAALEEILGTKPGVFFVPDYNTHWYRALAWSALSRKDIQSMRVPDGVVQLVAKRLRPGPFANPIAMFQISILRLAAFEWGEYVDLADAKDRWLDLAKRHRDEALRRVAQAESDEAKKAPAERPLIH